VHGLAAPTPGWPLTTGHRPQFMCLFCPNTDTDTGPRGRQQIGPSPGGSASASGGPPLAWALGSALRLRLWLRFGALVRLLVASSSY
jgi:hypothetical protein